MSFDIDVTLKRGEALIGCTFATDAPVTVLFGPSGVGKTSVLGMVAGLVRPAHGHVRVEGRTLFDAGAGVDVPVERRGAGYVFQEARLFPHLSVRRNLDYGAGRGAPALPREEVLRLLDIAHLVARWPRTLSGGEARRVAIGRALLSGARFLLLDEPLSSLDRSRKEEVLRALERLRDAAALPMLMVTHDRAEAERLSRHIVEM